MTQSPPAKAFGKFYPGECPPIRGFEERFKIYCRHGPDAWKSGLPSVQNLLDHLSRYTKSESSREKYLRHLAQFCEWSKLEPVKLVKLSKKNLEVLIQEFVGGLAENDLSRAYMNTVIKRLRTFFRINGYKGTRELHVHRFFVPSRYRKVPEYIPTKYEIHSMADASGSRRDRAIILALWSSGLRVSTLCALDYGDLAVELDSDDICIKIDVYPEMKKRVPDACKGHIAYYTFINLYATESLKSYIRDRIEKFGQIQSDDPLFHSAWTLWSRHERTNKRLGRRGGALIVKKSAKLAGISEWKNVTPHCLRKAFDSVLRSQTVEGGRIDKGTQQFFFGHILPGSQDVYYDKSKVEFHRQEYSKLDFSRISKISVRMKDKLVSIEQLEMYLDEGWQFIAKISNAKAIVRRGN